ncbi:FUSC family protein [Microbacterium hominis]|uniref:FUSC family protein n=1 Tax=Microbacterium hominis TaxID=162426 RepID=UPI0007686861|nr:FUSC family protein [Microbacterium hominis]KXC05049.1 hypothetical protein MhomT_13020 [Microbacterium hominis]
MTLTDVVAFHPSPGSWVAAVQAALAMTLLPTAFLFVGQLQLGLLATFGALIVLYLSDRSRRERAVKLPIVAAAFLGAVVVGLVAGTNLVASLVAICAVALVCSWLSLTTGVGPPGAIFPVLSAGAAAQLASSPQQGGMGLPPGVIIGMVALGAACGYAVVVAPLLTASGRRRDATRPQKAAWSYAMTPESQRILLRLVVAVVISATVSYSLGLHHVAWVLLAVIGILQKDSDLYAGTVRLTQRVVGTTVGAGIALLFLVWAPEGFLLIAVVGVLVFGFVLFLRRNLMLALMLVTPMALLLVSGGMPGQLAASTGTRLIDTLVGAAVALAVLLAVAVYRRARRSAKA